MDLPAYSLSNNAQDQGKGQVDTDRPAARVGYSTVYFHEQPVNMPVVPAWAQRRAPQSRARRLWARFSHWFMLYLILVLVIFFTFKDLRNLSLAVSPSSGKLIVRVITKNLIFLIGSKALPPRPLWTYHGRPRSSSASGVRRSR